MKYFNNILCLEYTDLVNDKCLSVDAYHKARMRGSITMLSRGNNGSQALIEYESLPDKYKELVVAMLGMTPAEYLSKNTIKQRLIITEADRTTIQNYTLPDGNKLPLTYQHQYINACKYLNLLANLSARTIRDLGFVSVNDFYLAVLALIKADRIDLPNGYQKLRAKVRAYETEGATAVISKRFCNSNSKKINDKISDAVLTGMIKHSHGFDDVFISQRYNEWAAEHGYKTICDKTVGNYRFSKRLIVTAERNGVAAWRNMYDPSITRQRPEHVLDLVNGDDNNLDMFFKTKVSRYGRLVVYVVIDAFNDYPLGYAVGYNQTIDLVKAAFSNAIHHIKELTGEYMIWNQVQVDHWGLKALQSWYESHSLYIPIRQGNARGKVIEQSFGKNWHKELKVVTLKNGNYSGNNITAVTKANWEYIRVRSKEFPELPEYLTDIERLINTIRHRVNEKKGYSKQQQWLQAYQQLPIERKKQLSDEKRILTFGVEKPKPSTITNKGLVFEINKNKLLFDVPMDAYEKHILKSCKVYIDPYDTSKVLATIDDARVQILCPATVKTKMSAADTGEGDRTLLNVRLAAKKALYNTVTTKLREYNDTLDDSDISIESLLQAGVMDKEVKQVTEGKYQQLMGGELKGDQEQTYQNNDDEEDIYDLILKKRNENK